VRLGDNEKTRDVPLIAYHYMSLEVTFARDKIEKPANVWSLACTLFHKLADRSLFMRHEFLDRNETIAEMVSARGILSQQLWGHGRQEESSSMKKGHVFKYACGHQVTTMTRLCDVALTGNNHQCAQEENI
jgi:hypothetical protein